MTGVQTCALPILSKIAGATGSVVAMDVLEPKIPSSCADRVGKEEEPQREPGWEEGGLYFELPENLGDFDGPRM